MAKTKTSAAKRNRRPRRKQPARRAAAAPPPAERSVDQALVSRTLTLLAEQDHVLATARRVVGAHLLDHYFAGDVELARSNAPRKAKSFAALAERTEAETGWDARDLSEAVRLEVVARSLPSALARELGASYLLRLAAVHDRATRADLAARIVRGELSGVDAKNAIAEAAATARGDRASRRKPDAEKLAAALERALAQADEDDAFTAGELAEVEDRAALARKLKILADRIAHLATRAAG